MTISFSNVCYSSPDGKTIFDNLSFEVGSGEVFAIIGKSGVGKSTILRLICGLVRPARGEILHDGAVVIGPTRLRGMVFQGYDAFEWMSVRDNVEFGQSRAEASDVPLRYSVNDLLADVALNGDSDKYPRSLSGGMRQRLAIIRALAAQPDVLCLDEPFSALDPHTKNDVRNVIVRAAERDRMTLFIVSHDLETAIGSCDRGFVLRCENGGAAEVGFTFAGFRSTYNGYPTPEIGELEKRILAEIGGASSAIND